MADVNTPVAEPSTATSPIQYDSWDGRGNPIVSKAQDPPKKQDSAPASEKSESPEAHAETAAESGTAKETQEKRAEKPAAEKPAKAKLTAEERIQQLESTIDRIRSEAGLKKTEKAEPSPAKAAEAPKPQSTPATRTKPTAEDKNDDGTAKYKTYEEFVEDLSDWKAEQREVKLRHELQMQAQQQKVEAEFAEAKKVYPDFEEKAKPIIDTLMSDADIPEAFRAAVGTSDVFTHLVYALSQQQAEALFELSKTNAIRAVMKLGVLEDAVRSELGKGKSPDPPTEKAEATEPPAPPKPRAPKPPSEAGGRGTPPADEQAEAARTGDFRAFEAAENRRKLAAK